MPARRATPPKPYPAIRVGVVGHRLAALVDMGTDFGVLAGTVHGVLDQIRAAAHTVVHRSPGVYAGPPRLRVISPLAEGTDQIVADEALRAGYLLHVPLPCVPAIYTAAFQPAPSKGQDPQVAFTRLIAAAESVQILDGAPDAVLDDDAYATVGRTVLRHADVLIAIWDGAPPAGPGGTGDVVAQARLWQVPVVRIDPKHPQQSTFEPNSDAPARQDLNALIEDLLAPPVEDQAAATTSPLRQYFATRPAWGIGGFFASLMRFVAGNWPPIQLVILGRASIDRARREWDALWTHVDPTLAGPLKHGLEDHYVWAEGLGNQYGTVHRDASSAPYALAPLAVLLALAAHWWEPMAPQLNPEIVGCAEAIVLLGIVVLYWRAVHRHYHDRWIDYRSLAEEFRQLAFLWPLGRPLPVVQLVGESEGEGPRFAWVGWYVRAVARDLGLCPGTWTPDRLTSYRQVLADRFVRSQCDYHDRTMKRFDRVSTRLHRATEAIFIIALGIALVHVIAFGSGSLLSVLTHAHPPTFVDTRSWVAIGRAGAILAIFLPALGAATHGFSSQGDFWNLARRSERMCTHLDPLATAVAQAPLRIEDLGVTTEKAAGVMRDEVVYWRVFVRLKPPTLV